VTVEKLRGSLVYVLVVVVGVVAFGWPFLFDGSQEPATAHGSDAWLWTALLAGLVVFTLALEIRRGVMTSAHVAVLGVLSAFIALLRLIDLPGGGNGLFFLVVLVAAAFGVRFGVLLALVAMAASAVVTAGIGPWLPYQMLALAALAALAGVAGLATQHMSTRTEVAVLAAVAWVCAFVYGGLMNLWSWPLIQDGGALSYDSALTLSETLQHYWSYYVATSFAWDAAGATVNVVLVLVLGTAVLRALRRVAHRLRPAVIWDYNDEVLNVSHAAGSPAS